MNSVSKAQVRMRTICRILPRVQQAALQTYEFPGRQLRPFPVLRLPFIGQMCENIAKTLKVPESKISIKATTTEKLGFAGREELSDIAKSSST